MARLRPSEEVLTQAHRVLKVAQERGVDRVLALDDAGLLLHPALRVEIAKQILTQVTDLIDEASVRGLTPRTQRMPATPLDTKQVIVGWLRVQVDNMQEPPA
jgi:hypothetical protein